MCMCHLCQKIFDTYPFFIQFCTHKILETVCALNESKKENSKPGHGKFHADNMARKKMFNLLFRVCARICQ